MTVPPTFRRGFLLAGMALSLGLVVGCGGEPEAVAPPPPAAGAAAPPPSTVTDDPKSINAGSSAATDTTIIGTN